MPLDLSFLHEFNITAVTSRTYRKLSIASCLYRITILFRVTMNHPHTNSNSNYRDKNHIFVYFFEMQMLGRGYQFIVWPMRRMPTFNQYYLHFNKLEWNVLEKGFCMLSGYARSLWLATILTYSSLTIAFYTLIIQDSERPRLCRKLIHHNKDWNNKRLGGKYQTPPVQETNPCCWKLIDAYFTLYRFCNILPFSNNWH